MIDEFERTYLAKELPSHLAGAPQKEILDIYLPRMLAHPILRIRKSGDTYEITKKQPATEGDASYQIEETIPLTKEEFAELATLEGKRVRKIRRYYTENNIAYEIDVFQDALSGLVTVDIEFVSSEAKAAFEPPTWLLAEVTQEKFIAGGMLCGKNYADIENELVQFGYRRLEL